MATATRKTKSAPVRIDVLDHDGKPTDYTVEVIKGHSITIHATKVERREETGDYRVNYYGPDFVGRRPEVLAWIAALGRESQNELASVLTYGFSTNMDDRAAACATAGDWLEEHGGNRNWSDHMNVFPILREVRRTHTITYEVGDQAEHSSYNLSYLGTITSITDKTVTIKDQHGDETKRLNLLQFCSRNWNGLEGKLKNNREWTD